MTLISRITALINVVASDIKNLFQNYQNLENSKQKKVTVIPITGNTTLSEIHNGAILHVTNTCNITIPTGLNVNFQCVVYAKGSIIVTFVNGGVTLNSPSGLLLKTDKMASLFASASNTFNLLGELATEKNKGLILDLPLQNNFTDITGINTMIAGGTSNLPTFTLEGGEYAATFNGSQSLKTNSNFVLGTDKVSISFWMKTNQTEISVPIELSSNPNINNAFSINTNYPSLNEIYGYSITQSPQSLNSAITNSNNIIVNEWRHIVFVIDINLPLNDKVKIYVNGNLATITKPQTANTVGSFGSYPLFIGQRDGSSYGFNGQMKFLKIFNYPLSQTEITNLYNKTM